MKKITVRAPATSANLGPGFDCMGIALNIWNTLSIEHGKFEIINNGELSQDLPNDPTNLVVTGVEAAFREAGEKIPNLRYICENSIPHGRGLGSSSAAIVSGLIAGAALVGISLTPNQLVKLAADIEGHPDNVAPAIYGGCTIGINDSGEWIIDTIGLPTNLRMVLFIPDTKMNTKESRTQLPTHVTREDAVFNIGRAAILVNALINGRFELLHQATQDRLHQPIRSREFPAFKHIVKGALKGGGHGAFLSGSGPSVLALTTGQEVTVSYEMAEAARMAQVNGKTMILDPTIEGAGIITE